MISIHRQISVVSGLNIRNGEVICDNHGDFWIYNHTGCVTYILAKNGARKEFQLIPEDKLGYIDYERYHIVMIPGESFGFLLMVTDCLPMTRQRIS